MVFSRTLLAVVAVMAIGCQERPVQQETVVDSALPRGEALRRFRTGVPEVARFSGGASSRDSLVQRFLLALEARDSGTLRDLVLTKAEFAYLYYPSSPQSLPPYDLAPELMWFMHGLQGDEGLRHTIEEFGGRTLSWEGYECPERATPQGDNLVWAPCVVRWMDASGGKFTDRLFGAIVSHEGVYKFVNYSSGRE